MNDGVKDEIKINNLQKQSIEYIDSIDVSAFDMPVIIHPMKCSICSADADKEINADGKIIPFCETHYDVFWNQMEIECSNERDMDFTLLAFWLLADGKGVKTVRNSPPPKPATPPKKP